ncbi:MAG: SAM-dependent methyltransferase [Actinobacteria bacterium]|nr:SAM-dependent methyltransferase [Actinomycetota bacterium]
MTPKIPPPEPARPEGDPDWEGDVVSLDDDPARVGLGHPALRTDVAHQARMYDYWLGGKDNFEADRKAGDAVNKAFPDTPYGARANRALLGRMVRYLAGEAGIRQFLDLGTGIPSAGNTHEVAQEAAPESRVVYVDNDPVVLSYAHALLTSGPHGATDYIDADLRNTATILEKAARTLDFSRPVAVTLLMILHAISDEDDPYGIVATLMDAVPSGSYLAISHMASDIEPEKAAAVRDAANKLSYQQYSFRNRAELMRFFDGLDMLEPGLVQLQQWRPDPYTNVNRTTLGWCGLARKP